MASSASFMAKGKAAGGSTSASFVADKRSLALPGGALVVLLLLQLTLVFTRSINWDEYSFYREVAYFADGRLDRPLQTIHVRFFAWLPGLFETSVDHIVVGRLFMFGCELITIGCIIAIARRFSDVRTALFAALAYISAAFVFQHGTSFRIDPIVTALLCSSLAVLTLARLKPASIIAFGILLGLAGMVSVKAVLYLPAFAGIALWRWQEARWSRTEFVRLALCGLAAAVSFAAIYALHAQGVTAGSGASGSAQKVVSTATGWIFFIGIPPYWHMAVKAALTAPFLAAMIFALPFVLWRAEMHISHKIAIAGLWLPISSIFFYTNTAAYFYVFLLAPLAIACAPVIDALSRRYSPVLLALVLFALGGVTWMQEESEIIDRQRQLERNVHEIFPEPVRYFDHNYMLGGWIKMNSFLTPQGLDTYHREGRLAYRAAMERETVPLFLANYPMLEDLMRGEDDELFLPGDVAALRNNYIEFSWPIWIAGKDFSARTGTFPEEFLVPGTYTVEGGELWIDGNLYQSGSVIEITRGDHEIMIAEMQPLKLVWGDRLNRPESPLEEGDLYVGF